MYREVFEGQITAIEIIYNYTYKRNFNKNSRDRREVLYVIPDDDISFQASCLDNEATFYTNHGWQVLEYSTRDGIVLESPNHRECIKLRLITLRTLQ